MTSGEKAIGIFLFACRDGLLDSPTGRCGTQSISSHELGGCTCSAREYDSVSLMIFFMFFLGALFHRSYKK